MKQKDKVLVAILSIWTFIHCYLMIIADKAPLVKLHSRDYPTWSWDHDKTSYFYPFTYEKLLALENFDLRVYDFSEFFVYVVGAWGLFLIYKFLSPK